MPGRPASKPANPTVIGRIARPVGVRGEVKVYSESLNPERLLELEEVTVSLALDYRKFNVLDIRQTGSCFRFALEGINSPEEAAILSGGEIVVPHTDRLSLPEDEYYIDDLIGCRAVSDDGEELGMIKEIWNQGHHDLWIIDGSFGEILVPAVKEFILGINLAEHSIVVKRVEGLWA